VHRTTVAFGIFVLAQLASAQEPSTQSQHKTSKDANPRLTCALTDLRVEQPNHISALFTQDGFELRLNAELKNGTVVSTISRGDGTLLSDLTIPNGGRIIPGLDAIVTEAALRLAPRLASVGINDKGRQLDLLEVYDSMAQALFDATAMLGRAQLRYALPYHTSVLRTSYRLVQAGACGVNVCNPSPEYLYGVAAFRCAEDVYAEAALLNRVVVADNAEPTAMYPCLNTQGGDWGCCGNYSGQCWYCATACLVHDMLCTNCAHWYCGSGCVSD